MEFTVDKENKTVHIIRDFAANLDLVWDAWTNPEILDQWWAPKPFMSRTKHMDFKVGGSRFYAMVSPEGQEGYVVQKYTSISPKTNFKFFNAFADKDENPQLPGSNWDLSFSDQNETTKVSISIYNESLERLERMIEMGFKEGFISALENLQQYIEEKFKLRQQNRMDNRPRVCTYLNFPGNTEEAFLFYRSVFQTEFINGIQRFGNIPADSAHPPVAESIKNMVLHVELPIIGGHILMGTDAPEEMGFTLKSGNNMHICLEPGTREEADRIFNELSDGGTVSMPLADMFFGAYFGEFQDKFGINWMVNVTTPKNN